jgi:hypothetical protein
MAGGGRDDHKEHHVEAVPRIRSVGTLTIGTLHNGGEGSPLRILTLLTADEWNRYEPAVHPTGREA